MASKRKKLLRRWHLWRTRKPQPGEIDDYGLALWMGWHRKLAALEAANGEQATPRPAAQERPAPPQRPPETGEA